MKFILFIIICSFSSFAFAQRIEIDQMSYAEYSLAQLKKTPANTALFSWGSTWINKSSFDQGFFQELESFTGSVVLHQEERQYLLDLFSKLLERANPSQKRLLQQQICKWAILDVGNKPLSSCETKTVTLQAFKERFPEGEYLVIEDLGLELASQHSIYIDDSSIYNWKMISSVYKPFSFRGSFRDLINQSWSKEKFIQGHCDSFTHSLDDFELISRGSVVFQDQCRQSLNRPETSRISEWYTKNKSWVIPVGIALLGAAAYQFKDKKIIIHRSQ